MEKRVIAARGAVNVDDPGDEAESMVRRVGQLMDELTRCNSIDTDDIISVQFTQTADLKRMNAAGALRRARSIYSAVPLFCAQEPPVEGMPPRIVRVMITWRGTGEPHSVYLGKAADLRPDLNRPG